MTTENPAPPWRPDTAGCRDRCNIMKVQNKAGVSFVSRLKFTAAVFAFGVLGTAAVILLNRWLIESMGMPVNFVSGAAVVGMTVGTLLVTSATLIGKFDRSIEAWHVARLGQSG